MKVYAGAPAGARRYLEAGRGRADDYYLAEGSGIARRFMAGPDGSVELAPLSGEAYEAWVAGVDPVTGIPRGRLRTDERAVRFVEVVVNGPKSWSLAAALHPDIAAAYDGAQDRAAGQIVGWLAEHATTRVGPAGGQVQVPVERVEAVTVRHYTSRAGDPHRHLHLQINARVFAAGKWRGLHTVGVRDSLAALNGIGHAAMATDPQFRAALAAHGFALNAAGEILQLAAYVGPFSARAAQIGRNTDRYEREWTAAHPGEVPGPGLRAAWDRRAWAVDRPDKVHARSGADLTGRWLAELADLGYRDRDVPVALAAIPVGKLNRDAAAEAAVARLSSARSAWNAADIRGEVEQLIAAAGIVADPSVRVELAEDLTSRAMEQCVSLLSRDGAPLLVPEQIRAWTSRAVLEIEADLTARLAARTAADASLTQPIRPAVAPGRLDVGQAAAVAALARSRPLVVIEGAAGAGKTTVLAATRTALEEQGQRLVVVTPTLKAARVACTEVGATAGSAAALVHAHGWRWDGDGAWTRLAVGQPDPVTGRLYLGPAEGARLRPGDLLVVDEAGMLDQDTARALLTIADECHVRVALLGDRHQLAAVGRGGVLDLAVDRVDPAAYLILDGVHRFTTTDPDGRTAPDTGYADLTLAMRSGADPGAVFDALVARGRIRIHPDAAALREAVARVAMASRVQDGRALIVADTRESVANLNAAIRGALVDAGLVEDGVVATTFAGQRIGVGDLVVTRRNDPNLGVANRDTWLVTRVGGAGTLLVTPAGVGADGTRGGVTPAGGGPCVLSAGYVGAHVELAFACTAHGAQGDTVPTAHLVVGESTGAAAAYVGMTRGREANTAHLIAAGLAEAREQWIAVFARDRADLGPAHAGRLAAAEAARYTPSRPLEAVLAELRVVWANERHDLRRLAHLEPQRDNLRQFIAIDAAHAGELGRLAAAHDQTARAAERAQQAVRASAAAIADGTDRLRDALLDRWDSERDAASAAARVIRDGPGRLRLRHADVTRATEQLAVWADRWRPHLPFLPTDPKDLAGAAGRFDNPDALGQAFHRSASRAAGQAHPDHAQLNAAADVARDAAEQAQRDMAEALAAREQRGAPFGPETATFDLAGRLAELEADIATTRQQLTDTRARIAALGAETARHGQAPDRLTREHATWQAQQAAEQRARRQAVWCDPQRSPRPEDLGSYTRHGHTAGRGIGR